MGYTASFTPTDDGSCTIDVLADVFADIPGNNNLKATQFTWTYDSTSPTMTITSDTVNSGTTTKNEKLSLTFTSSEDTTTFQEGDITLENGTLSHFNRVSDKVYTASFTPTNDGSCTIDVMADVFADIPGNNNLKATQFTWTYDSTGPSITSFSMDNTILSKGDTSIVNLIFSEPIVNFNEDTHISIEP